MNDKEIEAKFGLLVVEHQARIIITSIVQNQYTFLQRLNQFKAHLMGKGQRLKPVRRVSDNIVIAIIEGKN